jgi:hypothetical protein
MRNPKAILKMLVGKTENPGSLAAYITPICKMYTIHPTFLSENTAQYTLYTKILKYYTKKQDEKYETNVMPANKLENIVPYDLLLSGFCELEQDNTTYTNYKSHLRYILLAIFLNIKPKRADLGELRILQNTTVIPDEFKDTNCLLLNEHNSMIVMNKYKTYKHHGQVGEKLTPKLTHILKKSIELFPRDYLFISLSGAIKHQPYKKNNSYSQYVKRTFDKEFGKSMGVSLWRHVYIGEHVDFNNESYATLKENARLSGQSVMTQLKIYKYLGATLLKRPADKSNECPINSSTNK